MAEFVAGIFFSKFLPSKISSVERMEEREGFAIFLDRKDRGVVSMIHR